VMGRWPEVLAASRFFCAVVEGCVRLLLLPDGGGRAVEILWAGIV
jgi:hypothetical protein